VKSLGVHALVLALASGLSLSVWLKDEKADAPGTEKGERVTVWPGSVESVERVRFEGPNRKVVLDAKKDANGRYYEASVEKEEPAKNPHAPHDDPEPQPEPAAGTKKTSLRFVGVKAATETVEKLAPLLAVRALGKYDPKQAEEFGLDKPEGTLSVKLSSGEQSLVVGGATPGGQERYAKHTASGQLYAVPSDFVQAMLGAETRLIERDLHAFPDTDVTRLRIAKAGKSRELVAVAEKKGAFADPATPAKGDDTAGNWLTKVGRLRVTEYVEKPAASLSPESAVVRIEYFGKKASLGFLEVYKVPGEKGNDYLIRTEQTRWHVKVLSSVGEQVEQDLGSVLK
jgi:hypothetical protein